MKQTLKEYMKKSEEILNSMKPFSNMKSYDKITVRVIVKDCKTQFVAHPWKAAMGFSFLDSSLYEIYVKGKDSNPIAITDLEFVSVEIVDDGLTIEVKR